MNVEQLKMILNEYPPSMKLTVLIDRKPVQDTTVLEVMLKLMAVEEPDAEMGLFGLFHCIVRERVSADGPVFKFLEIDLR